MPRPRKPTLTLAASGALRHNPGRYSARSREPQAEPLSADPPAHLNESQRAVWREFYAACPAGVLAAADGVALELAASLTAAFRADPGAFSAARLTALRLLLCELGMTPVSRSKVVALPAVVDVPGAIAQPARSYLT